MTVFLLFGETGFGASVPLSFCLLWGVFAEVVDGAFLALTVTDDATEVAVSAQT